MEVYVPLLYMFIDIEYINPSPSQGRRKAMVTHEEETQAKVVMKGMVSRDKFVLKVL
jgi:hypothetical protein